MMTPIRYHRAVLSLRSDVRATNSMQLPFATLVIGGRGTVDVAAVAFIPVDSMSPAVSDICADLPVVLPLMIQDLMMAGAASPKDVMHLLEDSLRNTVFVSRVDYNLEGQCEIGHEGAFAERAARQGLADVLGMPEIPPPGIGSPRDAPVPDHRYVRPAKITMPDHTLEAVGSKWWATCAEPGRAGLSALL